MNIVLYDANRVNIITRFQIEALQPPPQLSWRDQMFILWGDDIYSNTYFYQELSDYSDLG